MEFLFKGGKCSKIEWDYGCTTLTLLKAISLYTFIFKLKKNFLAAPCLMQDISSLTRDQT